MEKRKTFSIITVAYNAENIIEKTIKSVVSQKYDDFEYIVIDGGSLDNTMSIIDKYRSCISLIVSEKDKGIYDAMNKAIGLASGRYINFMNCGDGFVDENVLQHVSLNIADSPDVIYGNTIFKTSMGDFLSCPSNDVKKSILNEMPFCHQSSFVKLEIAQSHPFDIQFKVAADYNLFLILYKEKRIFKYLDITISHYQYDRPNDHLEYLRPLDCVKVNKRYVGYLTVLRVYVLSYIKSIIPIWIYNHFRRNKYNRKFKPIGKTD